MKGLVCSVKDALLSQNCRSVLIVGTDDVCSKAALIVARESGFPFVVLDCSALSTISSGAGVDEMILEMILPLSKVNGRSLVVVDKLDALTSCPVLAVVATIVERLHQMQIGSVMIGTSVSRQAVPAELVFDHVFVAPPLNDEERLDLLQQLLGCDHEGLAALSLQLRGLAASRIRQIVIGAQVEESGVPSSEELLRLAREGRPAALADLETAANTLTFADVAGLDGQKTILKTAVLTPLRDPDKCSAYQVKLPSGILIQGPHGSGKTLLASALAGETKLPVVIVSGPSIISSVVGESEKRLADLFRRARQEAPCVVLLDQLNGLVPSSLELTETQNRVVACLAAELDACAREASLVVVVATVESASMVDAAILRRMELRLALPGPSLESVSALLRFGLARVASRVSDGEVEEAAKKCQLCSAATVTAIVNEAAMMCVRRIVSDPKQVALVTA